MTFFTACFFGYNLVALVLLQLVTTVGETTIVDEEESAFKTSDDEEGVTMMVRGGEFFDGEVAIFGRGGTKSGGSDFSSVDSVGVATTCADDDDADDSEDDDSCGSCC